MLQAFASQSSPGGAHGPKCSWEGGGNCTQDAALLRALQSSGKEDSAEKKRNEGGVGEAGGEADMAGPEGTASAAGNVRRNGNPS